MNSSRKNGLSINLKNLFFLFPLFLLSSHLATAQFTKIIGAKGLDDSSTGYLNGQAWGDLNDDGYLDVIFHVGVGGNVSGSKLFINDGPPNYTFGDSTSTLINGFNTTNNFGRQVLIVDFNNDGYNDVLRGFGSSRNVEIFYNDGPPSYTFGDINQDPDVEIGTPLDGKEWNTEGIVALDWNQDGWLDIVIDNDGGGNDIWQNDSLGGFTYIYPGTGAGQTGFPEDHPGDGDYMTAADIDNNGYVDIYGRKTDVSNYWFFNPDSLKFETQATPAITSSETDKGGTMFCDFDNDGDLDLFWTSFGDNQIWRNDGDNIWTATGIPAAPISTQSDIDGCDCGDYDNDGDMDIIIGAASGNSYLLENTTTGGTLSFVPNNIATSANTESVTFTDYNNDGDLDLFFIVKEGENQLWENDTDDNNYLYVNALFNNQNGSTRDAIGANVYLKTCNGVTTGMRQVNGGKGHGSQHQKKVHFGLDPSLEYLVEVHYIFNDGLRSVIKRAVVPSNEPNQEITILNTDYNDFASCPPADTDNDGIADINDLDDDNDGIPDTEEKDCSGLVTLDLSSIISANNPSISDESVSSNPFSTKFSGNITAAHTSTYASRPQGLANGDLRFGNNINTESSEYRFVFDYPVSIRLSQAEISGAFEVLETWNITTIGGPLTVNNPVVNVITDNSVTWNDTELNNVSGDGTNSVSFNPKLTNSDGNISVADSEWAINADEVTELIIKVNMANAGANVTRIKLSADCVPIDSDNDGIPNHLDLDSDNDGISDILEAGGIDTDGDGQVAYAISGDPTSMLDADNDGLEDSVDDQDSGSGSEITSGTPLPLTSSDSDGLADYLDIDADNDGIVDNTEAQTTDDYIAPSGIDTDGDGLDDVYDIDCAPCNSITGIPLIPVNSDHDSDNPDYTDTDTDNDGIDDIIEGHDTNGDGTVDGNDTPNANSGLPGGTSDIDGDGLLDGFDNDTASSNPTNTGLDAESHPDAQGGSAEQDWRDGQNSIASTDDFNNTAFKTPVSSDLSTNDIDPEGNNLSFSLDDTNGGMDTLDGTVTIYPDGTYTFTPSNTFSGETSFQYAVCDDGIPALCDTATVYIEVLAPIDPENVMVIANPDANTLKEGQTGNGNVLSNDLDPDDIEPFVVNPMNSVTLSGIDTNGNPVADAGALTLNTDGTYSFVPNGSFTGKVVQEYIICDPATPAIACDTSNLVLTVIPDNGNNTTFANDDAAITDAGVNKTDDVLLNDTDSENHDQTITAFMVDTDGDGDGDIAGTVGSSTTVSGTDSLGTYVANAGSLTLLANGTYTFVPAAGFAGNVVVPYTVCDDGPAPVCAEATLDITVLNVRRDYGDAPASYSPAWHRSLSDSDSDGVLDGATDVWLGLKTSFEIAQQADPGADADSDDDAIKFGSGTGDFPLVATPSTEYSVNVTVNSSKVDTVFYGLWVDWNNDGTYEDFYSGSRITASPATAVVPVTTPSTVGAVVNIRLRADDDILFESDSIGGKTNGEVEDYQAVVSLPVELTSFEGQASNCDVQLNWSSATEENFSHYEIERSEDKESFQMIEKIAGSQTSTITKYYQYLDETALYENYYRLKMVDLDGTFKYSSIAFVKSGCAVSNVNMYPNPVAKSNGVLNIDFMTSERSITLQLVNLNGKVLRVFNTSTEPGMKNRVIMDIADLPSGVYFVKYSDHLDPVRFIIQE